MNDVWVKMAEFLARLNGESVSRENYVQTPEYERMPGGFFLRSGVAGIHSGVCRLYTGTASYGAADRE